MYLLSNRSVPHIRDSNPASYAQLTHTTFFYVSYSLVECLCSYCLFLGTILLANALDSW